MLMAAKNTMKSYITLMTKDSYLPFTVALWDSWKKVESKYPCVVAIDNQIIEGCKNKMKELGIDYILIDTSDVDELVSKSKVQGNWREALKKLSIFKLYQYEKLVFLDGDTYMLKNIDSLFDMPVFTTTGRYNTYHPETVTTILGGLFVFEPNEKDYQAILNLIDDVVENRSDNKKFSVEKFNDEHCLSYIYKDRLNMLFPIVPDPIQTITTIYNSKITSISPLSLISHILGKAKSNSGQFLYVFKSSATRVDNISGRLLL